MPRPKKQGVWPIPSDCPQCKMRGRLNSKFLGNLKPTGRAYDHGDLYVPDKDEETCWA